MSLSRIASSCLCLALVSGAVPARAASSKPTVEGVLEAFQTQKLLEEFGFASVEQAVKRHSPKIRPARAKQILDLARRIYPGKNLYDVFKVAYSKQITLENMTATYKWLATPDGIKFRRASQGYFDVPGTKERLAYFTATGKALLKPNRKNAFDTFNKTTQPAELVGSLMFGGDYAVRKALEVYKPEAERETDAQIRDHVNVKRDGYVAIGREADDVVASYLFRDLKNAEVDVVTKFFASVPGEAHVKAYRAALDGTLKSAASTLATQLAKEKAAP